MRATPRTVSDNFGFLRGRMLRQIFRIVGQPCQLAGLDIVQGERQRHISVSPVMPIGLAVGRNVNQLRPGACI